MTDFKSAAVKARVLKDLVCPHCKQSNTPGKNFIEIDDKGAADCGFCGHGWTVKEG